MSRSSYTAVLLPPNPGIDPVGVVAILSLIQGEDLEVDFWHHGECSESQLATFHRAGVLPIGLGSDRFELTPAFSISELILEKQMGLSLSFGQREFLRLVADDNGHNGKGKGGCLNKHKLSVPRMLRKYHRFCDDTDKDVYRTEMQEIVRNAMDVVKCFILALDKNEPPVSVEEQIKARFGRYLEATKECNFAPLTVGRYLRDMIHMGYSDQDIADRIDFWLGIQGLIDLAIEKAKLEFAELGPEREFKASFGDFPGLIVEPEDHKFLLDAIWKEGVYKVVLARDATGHVAILSSRLGMELVASRLMSLEPLGAWTFVQGQSMILNPRSGPVTALTTEQIVEILANTKIRDPKDGEEPIASHIRPAGRGRRQRYIFDDRGGKNQRRF